MGPILLAGEEPDKRSPFLGDVVAHCPAQHGILCLQCVQDRTLGNRPLNLKHNLTVDARQRAQMRRKYDPDHSST